MDKVCKLLLVLGLIMTTGPVFADDFVQPAASSHQSDNNNEPKSPPKKIIDSKLSLKQLKALAKVLGRVSNAGAEAVMASNATLHSGYGYGGMATTMIPGQLPVHTYYQFNGYGGTATTLAPGQLPTHTYYNGF
jgi:hypothetical protein